MTKAEIGASRLSKAESGYDYLILDASAYSSLMPSYAEVTHTMFRGIAARWDKDLQSEWILRSYVTIKMMALATLMLSSAEDAEQRNLKITLPYLRYYGLFSCARAFIVMTPDLEWTREQRLPHSKVEKLLPQALKRLDNKRASSWGGLLASLRRQREIFSYHLPGLGLGLLGEENIAHGEILELAQLLCELCQFNSECLQHALEKRESPSSDSIDFADLEAGVRYGEEGAFWDHDDHYRLAKHVQKFGNPIALNMMATYGLVEDMFGSWTSDEDDNEGAYNPDDHWQYLFGFK